MWYPENGKEVRMLRPRTAHARKKGKNKNEIRTMVTRSTSKCLTDCANRASWLNCGEIMDIVLFPVVTFDGTFTGIKGLIFQN